MNKLILLVLSIAVLAISVPISAEAAKIRVLLTNVGHNVDNYIIQVSLNSHSITKTVYTGHQTCPEDATAFCYTNAGTFTFGKFHKGATIGVCNRPVSGGENFCDFFTYNGKKLQTVRSNVQELGN